MHQSAAVMENDPTAPVVMQFVSPLWGFPECSEYTLQPAARDGVWWLQGVTAPYPTFVLSDPFIAHPEYSLDLSPSDYALLGIADPTDVIALVMLALPTEVRGVVTANFRAPIVFNLTARRALQVVSGNEGFAMQQPINLACYAPREELASLA
jgi:flagellar assembly factor FliW